MHLIVTFNQKKNLNLKEQLIYNILNILTVFTNAYYNDSINA